jgi:hypothetical protein
MPALFVKLEISNKKYNQLIKCRISDDSIIEQKRIKQKPSTLTASNTS